MFRVKNVSEPKAMSWSEKKKACCASDVAKRHRSKRCARKERPHPARPPVFLSVCLSVCPQTRLVAPTLFLLLLLLQYRSLITGWLAVSTTVPAERKNSENSPTGTRIVLQHNTIPYHMLLLLLLLLSAGPCLKQDRRMSKRPACAVCDIPSLSWVTEATLATWM